MGISIANGLRRAGVSATFHAICDSTLPWIAPPHVTVTQIPREPHLFMVNDDRTRLARELSHLDPDLLIVYQSWLPIFPLLSELRCPTVLLMHQVEDRFLHAPVGPDRVIDFDPDLFDLVVNTEPGFSLSGSVRVEPVVQRNADEILPRASARAELLRLLHDGPPPPVDQPIAMIATNGLEGELDTIRTEHDIDLSDYLVLSSTNRDGGGIYPLIDYANAIDFLVAGAGYNAFYESRYFQIPSHFVPFVRNAEDQAWRVRTNRHYRFTENGADQLTHMISPFLEL